MGVAPASHLWNPVSVTGYGLAIVFAVGFGWSLLRPDSRPVARFEVPIGEDRRLQGGLDGVGFALAPNGSRFVYVGLAPNGGSQLWQRSLDDLEPDPVPDTEGARNPVVSPDGLSVVFEAGGVRTVSLSGGLPSTEVSQGENPTWGSDGMLYFQRERIIYRVDPTGGEPEAVTSPTIGDQRFPHALPAGRGLLLSVVAGSPAQSRIAVVGPEGGEVREILTGMMARYATSGHVVYVTVDGTLRAAPFDVDRLEVTGPEVAFAEGIQNGGNSVAQFALSDSGTLLYRTDLSRSNQRELVWVSRTGTVEPVDPTWTGSFLAPELSPEGTRLAVGILETGSIDTWVKQLDRGPTVRLTFDGVNDRPTWMPGGESVTFRSNGDLWTKRADGGVQEELELDRERDVADMLWSSDGEWLIYRTDTNAPGAGDILALRPRQDTVPVPLVATGALETTPALSPDGRWLAYASNETGRLDVYVVPFPNSTDGRSAVSAGGGREPVWSHSGRELFYRNGQGEMVAVEVQTEPTFSAGESSVLFSASEFRANANGQRQYDVAPDGERFIMIRQVGDDMAGALILVQNFFEELRQVVPD